MKSETEFVQGKKLGATLNISLATESRGSQQSKPEVP